MKLDNSAIYINTTPPSPSWCSLCVHFALLSIYLTDIPYGTNDFDTYSWVTKGVWKTANQSRAICEGFASLFNTMPSGIQTSVLVPIKSSSHAALNRATHPGAGAISLQYGLSSRAARDIDAGSELTIDYGRDWMYDPYETYKSPKMSVDWIRRHGWCVDHIEARPRSTNPHAGRGAFARTAFQAGQVVAPSPLHIFHNRSELTQVGSKVESVMLNYCIQVPGTEILLFPYGPGVNLINHNNHQPNVAFRWSKAPAAKHSSWVDLPLNQFLQVEYTGAIIMEIVALTDIQPGEELFLDYGLDWQRSWEQFVEQWHPRTSDVDFMYPSDMDPTLPFKTLKEQRLKPNPRNLVTVCQTPHWHGSPGRGSQGEQVEWREPSEVWPRGVAYCHVLQRYKYGPSTYRYDVAIEFSAEAHDRVTHLTPPSKLYMDTNVPHSAIRFVERQKLSDTHLMTGFRHPIMLPEHLVPNAWRELSG